MRGCRSCFEPRHSTGHRQEVSSLGSQPDRRQGILETTPRHPRRYESTAARASDPLSGQSVRVSDSAGDPYKQFSARYSLHNWNVNGLHSLPYLLLAAMGFLIIGLLAFHSLGLSESDNAPNSV